MDNETKDKNANNTNDLHKIPEKKEEEATVNDLVSDDNTINKGGTDGVTTFYLRKADDETNAKELVPANGEDSKKTVEEEFNPNTEVPVERRESVGQNTNVSDTQQTQTNNQSNHDSYNDTKNNWKTGDGFNTVDSNLENIQVGRNTGQIHIESEVNLIDFDISDCYQNLGDF